MEKVSEISKNDTIEINYFEQKISLLCVKELQFRQSQKICNIYIYIKVNQKDRN